MYGIYPSTYNIVACQAHPAVVYIPYIMGGGGNFIVHRLIDRNGSVTSTVTPLDWGTTDNDGNHINMLTILPGM